MKDKKHWYDGWFYSRVIDPWGAWVRECVYEFITVGSSVIDIGCGTGKLAFRLSEKCDFVMGIEASKRMVNFAKRYKLSGNYGNVDFIHLDALKLSEIIEEHFDYAVVALMLHEVSEDKRINILKEVMKISDRIIIADLNSPQPSSLRGMQNVFPELGGGIKHFLNSINFIKNHGIEALINQTGLVVLDQHIDNSGKYKVILAESI
ncbi:methyltransferase domain-containing protein [Candidatus Poribacteria bacterium]|nr:methyltransferase domain-containing protein [Candidatus Poribacteria bacterium]